MPYDCLQKRYDIYKSCGNMVQKMCDIYKNCGNMVQKMHDIYKNCGNMVCIGAEIIFAQSSFTTHYDVGLGTCGSDQTAATGM